MKERNQGGQAWSKGAGWTCGGCDCLNQMVAGGATHAPLLIFGDVRRDGREFPDLRAKQWRGVGQVGRKGTGADGTGIRRKHHQVVNLVRWEERALVVGMAGLRTA